MSGIQQTVIKVKAASVRMSNNVVCNARCLVVRKLSVCFAVLTFHRSLGVGYVNFFKPTYWTFGGATYSFQDGVGFTSTLAKSDDCCSCWCANIFWGISSFQLMFSVLANPPPPSRGHLYSFDTQSIPTQLTLTWFWGFTPNKQPFFRVSHIDCLHQQLGGEWEKVVILLRHFWLHLLYFISHFSSETVTFHAMC